MTTAIMAVGGTLAINRLNDVEQLDAQFCLTREDQPVVATYLDASFVYGIDAAQERDIANASQREWAAADANTRFLVFTTSKGNAGSIVTPVIELCKPAASRSELEELGAPQQTRARIRVISDEAEAAWQDSIKQLIETAKDEGNAAPISRILEMINGVSRHPAFAGDARKLLVYSDGLQNSDLGQFCV